MQIQGWIRTFQKVSSESLLFKDNSADLMDIYREGTLCLTCNEKRILFSFISEGPEIITNAHVSVKIQRRMRTFQKVRDEKIEQKII